MTERKNILQNGLNGSLAMSLQITSLLWLRTTTNYQYKHGYTTLQAMSKLYANGGFFRFYRGYIPCMFMGSLCRFGDIASYTLVQNNVDKYQSYKKIG